MLLCSLIGRRPSGNAPIMEGVGIGQYLKSTDELKSEYTHGDEKVTLFAQQDHTVMMAIVSISGAHVRTVP